jgi:hypothetical protein
MVAKCDQRLYGLVLLNLQDQFTSQAQVASPHRHPLASKMDVSVARFHNCYTFS